MVQFVEKRRHAIEFVQLLRHRETEERLELQQESQIEERLSSLLAPGDPVVGHEACRLRHRMLWHLKQDGRQFFFLHIG